MTGAAGLGAAAAGYLVQQSQATDLLSALQSVASSDGPGASGSVSASDGFGQSTASISGLGQLFSSIQQLQVQNPTQFSQAVSQIASTLQTTAAQQTGAVNQFLTALADSFQQAATTGGLPQLPPPGSPTYNGAGLPVTSTAVTGTSPVDSNVIQQLFASLASQVNGSAPTS